MPVGWVIVIVALWLAVICLAVIVLGVLRQIASRPDQDASTGRRAAPQYWGPAIGDSLPSFEGLSADGRAFTGADIAGKPGIMLFMSSQCGPCQDLAKQLRESDLGALAIEITVVTTSEAVGVLRLPGSLRVVTEADRRISDALDVGAVPFAIAVDERGTVRGKQVVNQIAHLAGLAFAAMATLDTGGRPTLSLEQVKPSSDKTAESFV